MPELSEIWDKVLRVAIYLRVSTEEQALHGYSLQAQEDALIKYAEEHGYKIVGIYRDEGFSARKPVMKRKVIQDLLTDVDAGKIDLILFTKLDRWFRNVGDYHTVQAVLDKNKVAWKAILEDYQTETADGRLKVNIMLSVAENEADRTSERIRFVFKNKLEKGEYCYGGPADPYGYKVEVIDGVRKLVKDPETEPILTAFWEKMIKYRNIRRSSRETNLEFGISRTHKAWMHTSRNEFYTGQYKGIKDFCPAYVDRGIWEELQKKNKRIKSTQGRSYLFAGLIKCPVCGCTLKSNYKVYPNDRSVEFYSYRCNATALGYCTYRRHISERKLEKYLLGNIKSAMEAYATSVEVSIASPKPRKKKADVGKLHEQLRRLNNIYIAGNLTDAEYAEQSKVIRDSITESEKEDQEKEKAVNIDAIRSMIDTGFTEQYETLDREERQRLWHSIIDEIRMDDNKVAEIIFKA